MKELKVKLFKQKYYHRVSNPIFKLRRKERGFFTIAVKTPNSHTHTHTHTVQLVLGLA